MSVDPAFLQLAIEVAVRAGEIQLSRQGQDLGIGKKGTIDLVTRVDIEIEQLGRQLIADRFPDHAVLAEELPNEPARETRTPRHCWVFDPLDGTVNYAHGVPIFCCSLALEIDGEVVLGVVFDPSRQELFVAERGEGARLNGLPLHVSSESQLVDGMLCTGFPYDVHDTADEVVGLFAAFVSRARAVRRLGSAAIDLCYVAAGRLDGFWEERLQPWDTAAAVLIVEEAGGRVTGFDGEPFDLRAGYLLASNGPFHDQMVTVVRDFTMSRSRNRTD